MACPLLFPYLNGLSRLLRQFVHQHLSLVCKMRYSLHLCADDNRLFKKTTTWRRQRQMRQRKWMRNGTAPRLLTNSFSEGQHAEHDSYPAWWREWWIYCPQKCIGFSSPQQTKASFKMIAHSRWWLCRISERTPSQSRPSLSKWNEQQNSLDYIPFSWINIPEGRGW